MGPALSKQLRACWPKRAGGGGSDDRNTLIKRQALRAPSFANDADAVDGDDTGRRRGPPVADANDANAAAAAAAADGDAVDGAAAALKQRSPYAAISAGSDAVSRREARNPFGDDDDGDANDHHAAAARPYEAAASRVGTAASRTNPFGDDDRSDGGRGTAAPRAKPATDVRRSNPFGDDDDDGGGDVVATAPERAHVRAHPGTRAGGSPGVETDTVDGLVQSTAAAFRRKPAAPSQPKSPPTSRRDPFDDDEDNDRNPPVAAGPPAASTKPGSGYGSGAAAKSRRPKWDDDDGGGDENDNDDATGTALRHQTASPSGAAPRPAAGRPAAAAAANPFGDSDDEDGAAYAGEPPVSGDVASVPKGRVTSLGAHKKRLCAVRTDVAYDHQDETLKVHIYEVEGLNERKFGKPDLYVKLYLSPDPKKKTKRKTAIVKGNTAPVFNETFTFPVPATDIAQRVLRMALWEHGKLGNSVLGEVSLPLSAYANQGSFRFSEHVAIVGKRGAGKPDESKLQPAPEDDHDDSDTRSIHSVANSERSVRTYSSATTNPFDDDDDTNAAGGSETSSLAGLRKDADTKPKLCTVRLGVGYSPEASLLRVNVMDVADLAGKEESSPDLYIKMFLVPDPKKATKRKTHVSTGTLTPHYDELFEWKVAANDLATKSLVVSLCEEGTLSNDILGETSLDLQPLADGRREWNDKYVLYKKTSGRISLTKKAGSGK